MADDTKKTDKTDKTEKASTKASGAGKKLIARVALKGDFDGQDGLGVALQEIPAGKVFTTEDAKLAKQLIDNGYAKFAKDADKEDDETVATGSANPSKIATTGQQ